MGRVCGYIGAGLLTVGGLVGCSAEARQRLKAFFFELPPPTPVGAAETGPVGPTSVPTRLSASPVRLAYRHRPYVEHKCQSCHDGDRQMQVRSDLLDSCRGCHTRYFGPEVGHAPVSAGQCTECHDMHRSEHRSLLKRSVLQTCVECHDEPEDLSQPAHAAPNVADCTACHDAHFGTGTLLREGIKPTG